MWYYVRLIATFFKNHHFGGVSLLKIFLILLQVRPKTPHILNELNGPLNIQVSPTFFFHTSYGHNEYACKIASNLIDAFNLLIKLEYLGDYRSFCFINVWRGGRKGQLNWTRFYTHIVYDYPKWGKKKSGILGC